MRSAKKLNPGKTTLGPFCEIWKIEGKRRGIGVKDQAKRSVEEGSVDGPREIESHWTGSGISLMDLEEADQRK